MNWLNNIHVHKVMETKFTKEMLDTCTCTAAVFPCVGTKRFLKMHTYTYWQNFDVQCIMNQVHYVIC